LKVRFAESRLCLGLLRKIEKKLDFLTDSVFADKAFLIRIV
jgi:hypothetical protein